VASGRTPIMFGEVSKPETVTLKWRVIVMSTSRWRRR
jgi:hypothetical protein